jgi:hypothetical protein
MSAFSPIDVPSQKKRKRGGASTNSGKMFDSKMGPPAGWRPRSPTFSEGDGTEQTRTMLNLLTLRNNKDKAAMEFIKHEGLLEEFEQWYKNNR